MFCQFHDDVKFLEMYNILQDPFQILNLASQLSKETIEFYKVINNKGVFQHKIDQNLNQKFDILTR